MANLNGGGPQVPFGDGSHVPIEDNRPNISLIFKDIFASCDSENTGLVSASALITYVTPFLLDSESEFMDLKLLLDPDGTNPAFDSEGFLDVMSQWTARVRNDITMRQISSNVATRDTDEIHVSSSSSKNIMGDPLCRINENEILNLSNGSSYNGNALDCSDTLDAHALHEQMKQLEYENRKLSGEVKTLKDQLILNEEQSDVLQSDYEKLIKKLKARERQLKDELLKNEKNSAEILGTSTSAKKQVSKLEKIVASYEREVSELKKTISDMDSKKKKLEDNNKGMSTNEIELKKIIFKLESEMSLKDQEVANLEEQTTNLQVQLEEHQQSINHYIEINECLKSENSKIEKRFREHVSETMESKNSSLNDASLNSPIQERSDPVSSVCVNDNQSNVQAVENGSGSSDSDMFWKVQLLNRSKSISDQSLQSELLKAEDKVEDEQQMYSVSKKDFDVLESRITDYERTIKELLLEVDRLKERNNSNLIVNHHKSRRGSLDSCLQLKKSCVTLQSKIENLECDSNLKYIKIVDLMEEIEKLKQETDQLRCITTELELERETLQDKLKAFHHNQEDYERILKQLDGTKEAHEQLQTKFECTLQAQRKISTEFDNVCCTNDDLNTKLKDFNQIVDQLKIENAEKTSETLNLKNENSRLEYNITLATEKQIELISLRDELNLRLNQASKENSNLKENLNKTDKEYHNVKSKCEEVITTKQEFMEQNTNLRLKVTENAKCIGDLKIEIENLKAVNQNLVQDINAKKSQVEVLKQMIEYQNAKLEDLKAEKNTVSEKMYACEKENENILKINKELSAEFKISEKKKLLGKVKSLEELNKGSHMEIQSLLEETKSIKDINSNILEQLNSLLVEKEDLMISNEKLGHSIQILKDEKRLAEGKLEKVEQQHRVTLKEHKLELKVKDDLNSKLVIEMDEKSEAIASLSKPQICKNCPILQQTIKNKELLISELESANNVYKSEERRNNRGASYDRLAVKIDRLEEKLNDKEDCLKQREGEIRDLELKNIELKAEFDDLKCDREQIFAENCVLEDQLAQKSTLENKFRRNLEEIQKLQNEIQGLNQERANLADEFTSFRNKSKSILEKKDSRLHASTLENTELRKEIMALQKKIFDLEKSLEKTKTASLIGIEKEKKATSKTKLMKDNLESIKKENVQLKLDLEELNNRYGSLDKKNYDGLERIGKENAILKQQVTECFGIISELEKKVEKAQHDLQKSEVKNLSIRKVLTDVQSNACEGVEDAMVKSMEIKNFEELVKEKSGEVAFLQDELKTCREELLQLNTHLIEVNRSFNNLSDYVKVIKEGLGEKRHRLARSTLTAVNVWRMKLERLPENRTLMQAFDVGESLEPTTEIFTGVLDEEMYRLKNQIQISSLFLDLLGSLKSGYHNVETQASSPLHQKTIKKSTSNGNHRGTATDFYIEKGLQTSQNTTPVKNQSCMTSSTTRDQSPDTGGLYTTDEFGDALTCKDFSTTLISASNEGKHKATGVLNVASPNLSDILEQIELVKPDSTAWTPLEAQEKFTILQEAFATDCGTVEERYQHQKSVRCRVEEKFTMETEKLVTTLILIRKLDREQGLNALVDNCLRQVEHIVCTFSQAFVSAMQYGALYHEQKIVVGINFMILHSVYLQDTTGNSIHQLKFTNTLNTEGSENFVRALQQCASVRDVDQIEEITSNAGCELAEERSDNFSGESEQSLKHGSKFWWWAFAWLLVILFVLCYAIPENLQMHFDASSYPWTWLSWSDFRFAFHLNYYNGPPPI